MFILNLSKFKKTYILNPYYTLRNDRKRIILCKSPSFKVPFDIAEDDIFVFIHPVFAIVLSLFNGKDNLEMVLNKMSEILNSSIFDNCRTTLGVCWSNVIMAYGKENWDFPSPNCPHSPLPYYSVHHN